MRALYSTLPVGIAALAALHICNAAPQSASSIAEYFLYELTDTSVTIQNFNHQVCLNSCYEGDTGEDIYGQITVTAMTERCDSTTVTRMVLRLTLVRYGSWRFTITPMPPKAIFHLLW